MRLKTRFKKFLKKENLWENFVNYFDPSFCGWETVDSLEKYFKLLDPIDWANQAFLWSDTKEGHCFWSNVDKKWKNILKNNFKRKIKRFPKKLEIFKVGAEIESSPENIERVANALLDYLGESEENSYIYELQLKPINITDFKEFFEYYKIITKYCNDHVEGKNDPLAGSMHIHLSLNSISLFKKWDFNQILKIKNLLKKHPLLEWRTAIDYRAEIREIEYLPSNSKEDWITINSSHDGPATIEVRLNENPLPLWVYLLPVLHMKGDIKTLFKKSYKYWKNRMNEEDFKFYKKIIKEYIKSDFDPLSTIERV